MLERESLLEQQVLDAESRQKQQADGHQEVMEEVRTNSDQRLAELHRALAASEASEQHLQEDLKLARVSVLHLDWPQWLPVCVGGCRMCSDRSVLVRCTWKRAKYLE